MAGHQLTSAEAARLDANIVSLAGDMREMREEMRLLREALLTLVRVEQKQVEQHASLERAFKSLAAHEERLQKIERGMPGLMELRAWAIGAIAACLSAGLWLLSGWRTK